MSVSLSSIFKSLIILVVVGAIGCSGPEQISKNAPLVVAAASDLAVALPELAKEFWASPGTRITPRLRPGAANSVVRGFASQRRPPDCDWQSRGGTVWTCRKAGFRALASLGGRGKQDCDWRNDPANAGDGRFRQC